MLKLAAVFYIGMALVALGLNAVRRARLVPLAFNPWFWPAIGAAVLVTAATVVFSALGSSRWEWTRKLEATFRAALGPLKLGEVLFLALASGLAEELFFRGALQPALGRALGSGLGGMILAAMAFAVLHTGRDPALRAWTLFALVLGLFLGAVTLLSGNILPAVLCHIAINAINLARIARPVARP